MNNDADVVGYYDKADLYSRILAGLGQAGLTQPTPRDLSAVDEFHIGGVEATRFVSDALAPPAAGRLLDIGCGIGGPARFIAAETGCDVTGIDLTKSFVETGNHLSRLVGLDGQVTLQTGNALALPFAENEFDAAYMIHVGMNISEKTRLIGEVPPPSVTKLVTSTSTTLFFQKNSQKDLCLKMDTLISLLQTMFLRTRMI